MYSIFAKFNQDQINCFGHVILAYNQCDMLYLLYWSWEEFYVRWLYGLNDNSGLHGHPLSDQVNEKQRSCPQELIWADCGLVTDEEFPLSRLAQLRD
jgi:hypothetical protein